MGRRQTIKTSFQNPIHRVFELQKPFTFFHTHVLDQTVMNKATKSGKSLEVDVSIDDNGQIFVGHPLSEYEFDHLPPPSNLPLEEVIAQSKAANLFLVLDCKDVRLLPAVQKVIKGYGAERCAIHSFTDALSFKPWPPKVQAVAKPGWIPGELPLEELLELKLATEAPLILSCHGLTAERVESEKEQIMKRVLDVAKNDVEVVNFYMPKDELMPLDLADELIKQHVLPLIPVDRTPSEACPKIYLGATDIVEQASDLKDF